MRGCLVGVVLVAAVAAFVGAVAFALGAPPTGLPPQFTPVPVSTVAAARFDAKLATAQAANAPTTVAISEEEATSKLVALLASEPSAPQIDRPQVAFRDGKVYMSGTTADTPIPIAFVITGRVEAVEGRPRVVVEQVETGRLPVSGPLRSQLDRALAEQDQLFGTLPIYVTDVRSGDGTLTLTGRPK